MNQRLVECYHCGLPVPAGGDYAVDIDGERRPMCCPGCQAVAETILAQGLGQFYRLRSARNEKAAPLVPEALQEMRLFDRADVQREFVHRQGDCAETSLAVEGITCAACAWLIERRLARMPGVASVGVNATAHRLHLRWRPETLALSTILSELASLGYRAHPLESEAQEREAKREERFFLARLGVAGLGMMQAMMYAANLYAGPGSDIAPAHEHYLQLVSLIVSLPVVLFSAWPFYRDAWRNLRRGHLVMDLPVSLAVLLAFAASAWSAWSHTGEIYFDSVTMFVFFLLIGRYLERRARQRAVSVLASQRKLMPRQALRVDGAGESLVLCRDLRAGDTIRVRPGETVAADGRILEGVSSVDEALLTGEPLPLAKQPGDPVIAGSINTEGSLLVEVREVGAATRLAALMRLQDQALAHKPRIAELADRIAGWVVLALLLSAGLAYGLWHFLAPDRAFAIMLSALVVTCPCALSLATPAAITAATASLARRGLLIARGQALESLARVDCVVMDKTGTLTEGRLELVHGESLGCLPVAECLKLAAALESGSSHPIARAFSPYRDGRAVSGLHAEPGAGLAGVIAGKAYRIGHAGFVGAESGNSHGSTLYLAGQEGLLARFELDDRLREESRASLEALRALGLRLEILSGDPGGAPHALGRALGIAEVRAGASAQDKLEHIRRLQAGGATVLMVGDGVNDAPVLAGADVSVAMGAGADLAKAGADVVLLNNHLGRIAEAVATARKTKAIIRENLAWALVYNILALPAALAGWVPAWLAAGGMSASSLLVVLNALRLNRVGTEK
ncbi:MAG: cadmium-translocating P-type ATPase [Gammaproteobacteria bacterium]|nr:cadmium-translocating P-type ATPase [Gammaproteobacteria bacterium]